MRRTLLPLLILTVGCASGANRPPEGMRPVANARLSAPLFFGSSQTTSAPVEVMVANPGALPMTVRRIRVESPGMAQYALRPIERIYRTTIGPDGAESFTLFATAVASRARLTPTEPLTVRLMVDYEVEGRVFREVYPLILAAE